MDQFYFRQRAKVYFFASHTTCLLMYYISIYQFSRTSFAYSAWKCVEKLWAKQPCCTWVLVDERIWINLWHLSRPIRLRLSLEYDGVICKRVCVCVFRTCSVHQTYLFHVFYLKYDLHLNFRVKKVEHVNAFVIYQAPHGTDHHNCAVSVNKS